MHRDGDVEPPTPRRRRAESQQEHEAMGEQNDTPPTEPPASTPPPAQPTADGKTFTQDDVNRIATRESEKAARKAMEQAAEQLGMSVEDAKAFIEAKTKADQEQLSEVERKLAEAQAAQAKANELAQTAARRARTAAIKEALVSEGIAPAAGMSDDDRKAVLAKQSRVAALVETELAGESDVDDDDIAKAVAAVKSDMPELFAATSSSLPPSGDITKPRPPAPGQQKTAAERGRERALAYQGKKP